MDFDNILVKNHDIQLLQKEIEYITHKRLIFNELTPSIHYIEPNSSTQLLSFELRLKSALKLTFRFALNSKPNYLYFLIFESPQPIQIIFGEKTIYQINQSVVCFSNLQRVKICLPNTYHGRIKIFSISNASFNQYLQDYTYLLPKIYSISIMAFYYLSEYNRANSNKTSTSYIICNQLIYQLIYDLVRSESEISNSVEQVRTFLLMNLNEPFPSLNELAKMCNMSVSSFKEKFKKRYGYTAREYFFEEQMKYASELLSKGISSKEISSRLQYANPSNFINAFKRRFGVTPSEYKKSIVHECR